MERVVRPELLDTDAGTPAEISASLADLQRINRWFGGSSTLCDLLLRVAQPARMWQFSVLDVGGARGDLIQDVRNRLAQRGLRLAPCVVDRASTHLDGCLPSAAADALSLPFASDSFDLVTCSLLAHHFSPSQLLAFVEEGLRVCRIALVINDLRRHPLHLGLVYAGNLLFRSRITRHDGPASVRAAYTGREMYRLLRDSSAAKVDLTRHYLFRLGVIVWKR